MTGLGWDIEELAGQQPARPVVDIFTEQIGKRTFSKYRLAKAYLRWTREHEAADLTEVERTQWKETHQDHQQSPAIGQEVAISPNWCAQRRCRSKLQARRKRTERPIYRVRAHFPRASMSPATDNRSRTNLNVKVLGFVQFGGPNWTVGSTIFEMWLGL